MTDRTDTCAGPTHLSPSTEERSQGTWRRWLQWLLLALPLAILAIAAWHFRNVVDDGFIYLRIVRNVLAGNGPVFNVGERVETYTGPLWVALLSMIGWVRPAALPWIAVLVGIAATVAAVGLAMLGSARLSRQVAENALLIPVGALVFVSVAVVWTFASTGLETGITFLWLAGCLWVLVRWAAEQRVPRWGLIVLGLGPLVRPELLLASAIFVFGVSAGSWRLWGWRGILRSVAWASALPVIYEVFRMAYFGQILATTATAKEGALLRPAWGWGYLTDFMAPYRLLLPLTLLFVAYAILAVRLPNTRWRIALLALPAAGWVNACFVVLMGGDYMHGRLLLPALFAIIAPLAVLPLRKDFAVGLLIVPWAIVSLLAFRVPAGLRLPVVGIVGDQRVTPADFGLAGESPTWWRGDGLYVRFGVVARDFTQVPVQLAPQYPPNVVAMTSLGLASYVLPLDYYSYDVLGLANPLAAHLELSRRALPGHEKDLPDPWLIAQLTPPGVPIDPFTAPAFERPNSVFGDLIPRTSGAELASQTRWARQALQCGELSELVNGPREPLTLSRAMKNVAGSFTLTRLRVPADPRAAYETFCAADQ